MANTLLTTFVLLLLSLSTNAQKLGFNELVEKSPDLISPFCVEKNEQNLNLLINSGISIKYQSNNWYFISATPSWIAEKTNSKELTDFYFDNAQPTLLADTVRAFHFVDSVHLGTGGLNSSYKGKGVILGVVDTGIDWTHPDFKDSSGNTRIIRYWDQTMPDNASSPIEYGYGFIWDSTSINNLTCTSTDNSGHGTTVAGQALGNGLANGTNTGMAPEATIIIVESDLYRPNWALTITDACDYIFKVADSLGMPAVVNISLGSYTGSHDGNDPATESIEAMLDSKPGRIVAVAAGNSGNQGAYHVHHDVTSDTSFVWFLNNASSSAGSNSVFFDLWSDDTEAFYDMALGANSLGPNFSDRGRTQFVGASSSLGVVMYDTIWNGVNRIATVEYYTEVINNSYHLQLVARLDSTSYRYRFETTGTGSYDLWSASWLGMSNMIHSAPTLANFPDSSLMLVPDEKQSIVSNWNCSEKVLSVGNMQNRYSYIDFNMDTVTLPGTPPGMLSVNSSKGPTRHNLIKPDVTAAGDISMCAAPIWFLTNPANFIKVDSGGWHARNGGTSMASPVLAGIAALYLERCDKATYQNFIDDIQSTAYSDLFSGVTPNNSYGYGKAHALNALLEEVIPVPPTITSDWISTLTSSEPSGNEWYLNDTLLVGETNQTLTITPPFGTYEVLFTNSDGCTSVSNPLIVNVGIDEIDNSMINTYPNPSNTSIVIDYPNEIESAILYDINGQEVPIELISTKTYSLKNVSKGTYFLKIKTNEGIFTSKIIRI